MSFSVDQTGTLVSETDNASITLDLPQPEGSTQVVLVEGVKTEETFPLLDVSKARFILTVPQMLGNRVPTGDVYSSFSKLNRKDAFKVFSRDVNTYLEVSKTYGYVIYKTDDDKQGVYSYTLTTPIHGTEGTLPKSWKVLGSSDNESWVVIDSRHYRNLELATRYSFRCQAPHSYKYIKFEWMEVRDQTANTTTLCTIDYYTGDALVVDEVVTSSTDVGVYTTENEIKIQRLVSCRVTPPLPTSGLVVDLPLNRSLVDTISGDFATMTGTPSYVDLTSTAAGVKILATNSQRLELPNAIVPTSKESTFMFRGNIQASTKFYTWIRLATITDMSGNLMLGINTKGSTAYQFQIVTSLGGSTKVIQVPSFITKDSEFTVAITLSDKSVKVFIDGLEVGGFTCSTNVSYADPYTATIGNYSGGINRVLIASDVKVYDRVLPLSDISLHATQGKKLGVLPDKSLPKKFGPIVGELTFNGKPIKLDVKVLEVIPTRRKYKYLYIRLTGGTDVNYYSYLNELEVTSETGTNLLDGSKRWSYGLSNIANATDGNIDTYAYTTGEGYVRYKLDDGDPVQYVQHWEYVGMRARNILVALTNCPYSVPEEEVGWNILHSTDRYGVYTTIPEGRIESNLQFDYAVRVERKQARMTVPPEYYLQVGVRYKNKGTKLHSVKAQVSKNLWHLKPQLVKTVDESISLTD